MMGAILPSSGMAERCLWLAVVAENLNLVLREGQTLKQNEGQADARRARAWVGTADFRLCCELAGMNPDYVLRWFAEQMALPLAERHTEAIRLRHVSTAMAMMKGTRHAAA